MCAKPSKDNKPACLRLGRALNGADIDFSTTDGTVTSTFLFHAGTVAQVKAENFMLGSNFQEQLAFLAQKYGPPTKTKTNTYQNAFGAKWDCGQAVWVRIDDVVVIANESIENLPNLGPTRKLSIVLLYKSSMETAQSKQNPY
jgi:hypothetical protein